VLFWIIAAVIIAAIIVAWIFWASDLGRSINPQTDVPMTPGYAPATSAQTPASVPATATTRPAPAIQPNAMSNSTMLPPPASAGAPPNAPYPPRSGSTAPVSGGTH
jgi:hypothetical protein